MAMKKVEPKKSESKNDSHSEKASEQKLPRRVIVGWCLIGWAVITLLVSLVKDAFIPGLYFKLICGLLGQGGFYASPFALVVIGILKTRRKEQPGVSRSVCAVMTVITLSALTHLFTTPGDIEFLSFGDMWMNGINGEGGGLIGTLLGVLLHKGFSFVAYLILLFSMIVCMMSALNYSPISIFKAYRSLPHEGDDEAENDEPHPTPAEKLVHRVHERQNERKRQRSIRDFDVPVDDVDDSDDEQPSASKSRRKAASKPVPVYDDDDDDYDLSEDDDDYDDEDDDIFDGQKSSAEMVQRELDLEKAPTQHTPVNKTAPKAKPAKPAPAFYDFESEADDYENAPAPVIPDVKAKVGHEDAFRSANEIAMEVARKNEQVNEYEFPPVSLLEANKGGMVDGTSEMQENSRRLADTLKSFGIEPHIVNVTRGPSVTRYELELERGVKLSKITNLADDIALSLGTSGVRISAIPDRISVVGIEVPNKQVSMVMASEVIDSANFRKAKSDVTFAVGKDIGGSCIVGDIAKLPHLLIAGTTGSGKSVCMNTLIVSLLYKSRPEDVRFIMVDPKMVEFSIYDGIPHLLVPVVKDAKKAAGALQWAVTEMMRRYRLMSDKGVRDLESYNKVVHAADDPNEPPMEKIVVMIDELADLMMVAAKEVEDSICRIAQMGRAAGVHLVIATQRPSANVITGLMKANIPSRIAFAVASAMESRIILDNAGAEKLVGKGDMLYAPLGGGKPKRVQGCFISDEEVSDVVAFIKRNSQPSYSNEVLEQMEKQAEKSGGSSGREEAEDLGRPSDEEADELLPNAVEVLLEIGQASTSMLQRRLKLGYARAARIMDQLEERGIVGPFEGSKPRQLLVTKEQWAEIQESGFISAPPQDEDF